MFSGNIPTPVSRSMTNIQYPRNKNNDCRMSKSLASISSTGPIERYFEEQSPDDFTDFLVHDDDEKESPNSKILSAFHLLWGVVLVVVYCILINSGIKAYFTI